MNDEQTVGRYRERLSEQTPAGHLDLRMDLQTTTITSDEDICKHHP